MKGDTAAAKSSGSQEQPRREINEGDKLGGSGQPRREIMKRDQLGDEAAAAAKSSPEGKSRQRQRQPRAAQKGNHEERQAGSPEGKS